MGSGWDGARPERGGNQRRSDRLPKGQDGVQLARGASKFPRDLTQNGIGRGQNPIGLSAEVLKLRPRKNLPGGRASQGRHLLDLVPSSCGVTECGGLGACLEVVR